MSHRLIVQRRSVLLALVATALLIPTTGRITRIAHVAAATLDQLVCIGSVDGGGNECVNKPPPPGSVMQAWPCSNPGMGTLPVYFQAPAPVAPVKDSIYGNTPPPPGFSPLQGTADQRRCWGFPQEPTNPTLQQKWIDAMSHYKQWVPGVAVPQPSIPKFGRFHVERHAKRSRTVLAKVSGPWAGYVAEASNNGGNPFYDTQALFRTPAARENDQHSIGVWAGMGGTGGSASGGQSSIPGAPASTDDLIQAGVVMQDPSNDCFGACAPPPTYTFFYEDVTASCQQNPQTPNPACDPMKVSAPVIGTSPNNEDAYVDVSYNNDGQATYFLENYTTGETHTYYQDTDNFTGSSAQWVEEDATASNGNDQYKTYFPVAFYTTGATSSSSSGNIYNATPSGYNVTPLYMGSPSSGDRSGPYQGLSDGFFMDCPSDNQNCQDTSYNPGS